MVNKEVRKIDSEAIVTGKPIYTEDLIFHKDVLTIKLLRSPHAFAKIKNIDIKNALKVKGVVNIFTYKDVPNYRYSMVGESYPEASPHDQLILEDVVRYVGDEVAIIAAEAERAAIKAMKLIKVEYEVMTPILDARESEGNKILIHEEDDLFCPFDFGLDATKNIVSREKMGKGDVEKEFKESDVIVEHSYMTQSQAHCMMETHRAYTYIDTNGRLVVTSANQSAYHMRRQVSKALGIPLSKVRVIKPRIGGGFGGKNIAVTEIYASFVTWMTKRPVKLIYTREETFAMTNTRHQMFFDIKIGADKEGNIKAIDMKALNNTGAYGDNGPSVCSESGHNVLPTYNNVPAIKFDGRTVYTNLVPGGALRGYGATQGTFALDCAIDELAHKLNMDPTEIKLKNIIKKQTEGGIMNFPIRSCALDECIIRGKKLIGWDEKYPVRDIGNNKVRAVGMSVGTHGSGIANIDMAIVNMRMDEDGTYKLFSGSSDLGTGSDTILAQIAAKALNTSIDRISVYTGDTDMCPYDTGAYASCTTYVTGNATIKSAESLKQKILKVAQKKLDLPIDDLILYEDRVCYSEDVEQFVLLSELGKESVGGGNQEVLYSSESYGIQESAKPFLAGFAEIELDKTTGEFKVINYACSTDCGTVMNPALARIQVEGGVTQGIGLAMYEDPRHGSDGKLQTSNLLQYKVPTKKDIGNIIVDFVDNYEPTGPYGAKSLGEIVIHTPAPAIANAIYNATGVRIRELPITSEKVYMAMKKLNQGGK
ncbi:molybdopterin-dependent oxidoreductase [Clostridioides difficile]|uniref:xanthine dehydrogenase family protein molybdopterin-binding subunit n=1 Tax=Clostridioides difficile TaxID=1496 RepID=UPI00038C8CC2|nr:molybdopterin cofactor-binding domain-containing protein [Clostridioides difficile]EGT3798209.1 aldehyde oxidase [Clostridioides difficile]EGT3950108.1 aldehyde oxidase [Clostridioides difficile]EGT4026101.1 aldehyde oxidase [Clostridioides difficile]EGT4087051.1 aldehyde oxidase [Clostridioides difficile]EGT4097779.1 aldehyde oxidase [Clostridioides difficile]